MLTPVRLLTSFTVHTDRISFRGMVSINHYATSESIPFLKIPCTLDLCCALSLLPTITRQFRTAKFITSMSQTFIFQNFVTQKILFPFYIEKSIIFSGKKEVHAGQTDFSDFLNHTGRIQKKISSIIPLYLGQSQRIFNCENTGTNSTIGYRNCLGTSISITSCPSKVTFPNTAANQRH